MIAARGGQRLFALVLVLLCGCGERGVFDGEGDVVAIDEPGPLVTIDHDEIPDLMAAMTMRFMVRSREILDGVTPGTRVRFGLVREGQGFMLTRVKVVGPARRRPGSGHDHSPQHGGIVAMTNTVHVEALAVPDGRVRVWLSDLMRKPLPPDRAAGTVSVQLADGPHTAPLAISGDRLEASLPPLAGREVHARVQLVHEGEDVDLRFVLPLAPDASGSAAVQVGGCRPPAPRPDRQGPIPGCTMTLEPPPWILAPVPGTSTALMARDDDVALWEFPAVRVLRGLAPAPPDTDVVPGTHFHRNAHVMAVRPGPGRGEVVVAFLRRLFRYDLRNGAILAELERPVGFVTALAWTPDGERLLVGTADESTVRVVDGATGKLLRSLVVDGFGPVASLLVSEDGANGFVGSEHGQLARWSLADEAASPVVAAFSTQPITAMASTGGRVIAIGADGRVRVLAADRIEATATVDVGSPLTRLALDPAGGRFVTAGQDQRVRVHRILDGQVVSTLEWHSGQVFTLAFAGDTLVSSDADGEVAVWFSPSTQRVR